MKVLITGTCSGIGRAMALKFLKENHDVVGIDRTEDNLSLYADFMHSAGENLGQYTHFVADISDKDSLPYVPDVEILINNAGIQTTDDSIPEKDISTNLLGSIYVTQKYAFQPAIKSVLFNASVSALNGNEFAGYVASKAGVVGYMKHVAIALANQYHATCNAICFGGVATDLNKSVMEDKKAWDKIMAVTPLKRWATPQEAAEWCYFLTVVNTFCTGQAINVSGGERNCADLFIWPNRINL